MLDFRCQAFKSPVPEDSRLLPQKYLNNSAASSFRSLEDNHSVPSSLTKANTCKQLARRVLLGFALLPDKRMFLKYFSRRLRELLSCQQMVAQQEKVLGNEELSKFLIS